MGEVLDKEAVTTELGLGLIGWPRIGIALRVYSQITYGNTKIHFLD